MHRDRLPVVFAVFALLFVPPAAIPYSEPTVNVNGTAEQVVLNHLENAVRLEQEARDLLDPIGDKEVPDQTTRDAVAEILNQAGEALTQAHDAIDNPSVPFQSTSDPTNAGVNMTVASVYDGKVLSDLDAGKKAKKLRKNIDKAVTYKEAARAMLQGINATAKTAAAYRPPETGAWSNYSIAFQGNKDKDPAEQFRWAFDFRGMLRYSVYYDKESGNRYLGFTSGNRSAPAYGFFNINRGLRPPFRATWNIGIFSKDPMAASDAENAFGCIEFDKQGSSPLEFLAICGRYSHMSGGFQAFAESNTGAVGSVFLPGAQVATFRTHYSGASFSLDAKPLGSPDGSYQSFGSYSWAWDGQTPFVPGVGASGVEGHAEIGVDDILIFPQ